MCFCHFRWVQTGTIHTKSHISSLSWNLEGTRLLTGGVTIQMWHGRITHKEDDEPTGKKLTVLLGRNLYIISVSPFWVLLFLIDIDFFFSVFFFRNKKKLFFHDRK